MFELTISVIKPNDQTKTSVIKCASIEEAATIAQRFLERVNDGNPQTAAFARLLMRWDRDELARTLPATLAAGSWSITIL